MYNCDKFEIPIVSNLKVPSSTIRRPHISVLYGQDERASSGASFIPVPSDLSRAVYLNSLMIPMS